jgi:large subunit ribosomal protein L14
MIQVGTTLHVVDNSGARKVQCIKVKPGYRRRYAKLGDFVLVSIKELRLKRKESVKVKKGDVHPALVVQVKTPSSHKSGDSFAGLQNLVVLLTKQNKCLGTRIFASLPNYFRKTKFFKALSLAAGSTFF